MQKEAGKGKGQKRRRCNALTVRVFLIDFIEFEQDVSTNCRAFFFSSGQLIFVNAAILDPLSGGPVKFGS
jgi:hypothetical protein